MTLEKKNYHRVIRMQPDVFRGEVVNIGVLIFDKETEKHTVELLPIDHPKVSSVVLKGMTPVSYERLTELVNDIFESLDSEKVDPFENDNENNEDVIVLDSLIEEKVIFFSQPSVIRSGADLEQIQASLMKAYVL